MINVNWQKIKPFENKKAAICLITTFIVMAIAAVAIGIRIHLVFLALKMLTALLLFLTAAFNVHIESRMLQIYMLMGVLDFGLFCAALVPVNGRLTILLFVISLLAFLVSLGLSIFAGIAMKKGTAYNCPEPDRSKVFAGKKVMFFSPHEDDEINLYGGIIEQYVKYGSEVRVIFTTNGDYKGIGKIRIKEAIRAAKKYSVPEENLIFLGYSDSMVNDKGFHIYNCGENEELVSRAGYSKTYGCGKTASYKNHAFTRKNMLCDIRDVILEFKPDTLFCCDYDAHADHRASGLLFDEAMEIVLRENPLYRPEVYKGFAYSTAWKGRDDYYSLNAHSTRLSNPSDFMTETNLYDWKDRVRFPVAVGSLSRVLQNSSVYEAMAEYSSQTATDHAGRIINSDKVFWKRRTDSVLHDAKISATSGNAEPLIDFKLADSKNIMNENRLPLDGVWTADSADENKMIIIKLPVQRRISSLAVYENPSNEGHIMNAVISFGSVQYNTGELKPNGAATVFEFPPVNTSVIGIKIKSYVGVCSLAAIEAFEAPESNGLKFIKFVNSDDDFCYDYITNRSGRESFGVYTYPEQTDCEFEISSDNECLQYNVKDGMINIFCPEDEEGILTVRAKSNPEIYDCVHISNPDSREREIIRIKQKYEQIVFSLSMQWDYYRGLLRRLAIYFPFFNK